nr:hypothetical protein [Tanacetum cinerariifolium]
METFRDMLQIFPNIFGRKFVDPPFEEEILAFIIKLGYSGDIKSLSDVKVDTLHQPWRTFGTIINKCLSGKGINVIKGSTSSIDLNAYSDADWARAKGKTQFQNHLRKLSIEL